jgi:hypothetical protein
MASPARRSVTRGCLYSYYRADPAHREALRGAVEALFRSVSQIFGVEGRWMQRKDDPDTFMEIYAGAADVDALAQFVREQCERSGFRRLLADSGVRHDELFVEAG